MKDPARRRLLAAGACLAAWPMVASAAPTRARVRESRALMGTKVDVAVQGEDAASLRLATQAAYDRMAALAAIMSHFELTSRVSAIGLAAGLQPVEVEPELMAVLRMAQAVSRSTHGAFDATVGSLGVWQFDGRDQRMPETAQIAHRLPSVDWRNLLLDERKQTASLTQRGMRLDLGGIAKLYILQAGLDVLKSHGIRSALVNGGGDVLALSVPGDRPWRVGIRDPRQPQRLLGALDIANGIVASSGDYERFFTHGGRRWHHVLDPRTGQPTQGVHGVTLVADTLEGVNGLGAATMVLGANEGRELLRRTAGTQTLIAGADGSIWLSEWLRERLQPVQAA
jgi:FAD:protein FMN transferase